MVAGKVTEGALEWPLFCNRGLVGLQVVAHQLLSLLGCKAAALAAVTEVELLVFLQLLTTGQSLLTSGTL